ncbi:bifunctional serine/threonine-protein kinase/formylglycine-generating enzyme family protein [Microbulbifer hydrolyticus]|uniref:Protein kinase n=1 Tax=Microbulbifer hydrolyticus TaxID=48074 RepID=A0A6P1T9D9_9GAMM|nr:bifunctional serine/threonine-protein kinase/formylglycine-generating enzyme family protein [Microbulbifer hydrolyticus]MBB5211386.1 putative Ser/Thr protein kinase [Microbulbifer hydrolyticus]QHQ37859.1 protein kinase [Microbulbifer hydrolyticus]
MNDNTRIVKTAAENLSACDDADVTVFVGNENTGANDHPPIGRNPGLVPSRPGQSAGTPDNPDSTVIVDGGGVPGPLPRPREAVHFEPSTSREGAVTKTVIKGRFELDKLLGVGGMGAVYKALDRRKLEASDSDPYVAIKLLNEDFQKHPDAFISLQREARKSQTLAHPNIVTVYDFDREGDRVFMTMEYLEGSPLDKLLRERVGTGFDKERAESILRDVSRALIYAHSHRIVHSDFKPGNIFITAKKGAKVIDFGIARAVSEGGIAAKAGEKTVFDAGTLGALTPAYASLEMLNGGEPQPGDDVFALGCVAYELFSGRHPYGRIPADKALEKKLKPARIRGLSRRQWRALESALAFRRKDRPAAVEEFTQQFFGSNRWKWISGSLGVATIAAAVAGYTYLERENTAEQNRVRIELEQKHEVELLESRIADKREAIDRLVELSVLTPSWERDLRVEIDEYTGLNPADTDYIEAVIQRVSELFVSAATGQLTLGNLDETERMLERAADWNYSGDAAQQVETALNQERAELRQRLEAERIAAAREAERLRAQEALARKRQAELEKQQRIDAIVDDLEVALRCRFSMDIPVGVGTPLRQLAAIDQVKGIQIRPVIADELGTCLKHLAGRSPTRTSPLLADSRALLPAQQVLQNFDLDYCAHLQPGSGGRGDRYSCADPLVSGGEGPEMVVVNGEGGRPYAVSKYEVSTADFRKYCLANGDCSTSFVGAPELPIRNISLEQAQGYLAWLSGQTGREYRLPTEREWFAASSVDGRGEVADRNCFLTYGGISKGSELVAVKAGTGNPFGLLNTVGNVREWVWGADGRLIAAGGSRLDPMSRCLVTSKVFHSGAPDDVTGFRVVRNLSR